jgi:hypothetical protein
VGCCRRQSSSTASDDADTPPQDSQQQSLSNSLRHSASIRFNSPQRRTDSLTPTRFMGFPLLDSRKIYPIEAAEARESEVETQDGELPGTY